MGFWEDDKGKSYFRISHEKEKGFRWMPSTNCDRCFCHDFDLWFYLAVQLKGLLGVPVWKFFSSRSGGSRTEIVIEGRTDPTASVAINGQKIKKNRNGTLANQSVLSEGVQTVTISATGQNGKNDGGCQNGAGEEMIEIELRGRLTGSRKEKVLGHCRTSGRFLGEFKDCNFFAIPKMSNWEIFTIRKVRIALQLSYDIKTKIRILQLKAKRNGHWANVGRKN